MSKNLIIVVLGTLVLLFILDETCIWNFLPDKCSKGVVVDSTNIRELAAGLGYDICACDNRSRFTVETPEKFGGTTIPFEDAVSYLKMYRETYSTPMFGAYLSKKALDRIFCADPKANGIYCYAGMLKRESNEEKPVSFIVVEGATYANYEINTDVAGNIFMSSTKTLCPDECGSIGVAASTSDSATVSGGLPGH